MIRFWDMDYNLQAVMSALIQHLKNKKCGKTWRPGTPLKILLAGYVGACNTGSEVRVNEMIRQLYQVFGKENIRLTTLSLDLNRTKNYFSDSTQLYLPKLFPYFLYKTCPQYDGVIACEGSMFKSSFANALTTYMVGCLGLANAESKLSIGYGAEAGHMAPYIKECVRKNCQESFIICRNTQSQKVLNELGIKTTLGADSAWTFVAKPPEYAHEQLRKVGWDGKQKIFAVLPINPFFWPVIPSLTKTILNKLFGLYKELHYSSIYFHQYNQANMHQYQRYLSAHVDVIEKFAKEKNYFTILVGMERLDKQSCNDLNEKLSKKIPVFNSEEFDIYSLISIIRSVNLMLSSRFHGIVCSMTDLVPSAGIAFDERIINIMEDRSHHEYLLRANDPDLKNKLIPILENLEKNQEKIKNDIANYVVNQLKAMATMGPALQQEFIKVYPNFPLIAHKTWQDYLPPLSSNLQKLLEQK